MRSETTRRQFLGGLAALGAAVVSNDALSAAVVGKDALGAAVMGDDALGAGAALGADPLAAQARGQRGGIQAARTTPGGPMDGMRVDTHNHFTTPSWLKTMADAGLGSAGGRDAWSPQILIDAMDRSGTRTAMISTGQFIWRLGPKGRGEVMLKLSRDANEFGAKLIADHPGRFGLLAQLPLPNVGAALKEIAYAFDTLKADGIGITTSYDGKYISHPSFTPIIEELNRRRAVVYSHPAPIVIDNNDFAREEETTRNIYAVVALLSGSNQVHEGMPEPKGPPKYPNITWMFSHAGGTMPMLIQRLVGREMAAHLERSSPPNSKLALLRSFYYDTAQAYNSAAMGALKKVVTPEHILFGTDMLGGDRDAMKVVVEGLNTVDTFNDQERAMIYRTNALKIFPRLART